MINKSRYNLTRYNVSAAAERITLKTNAITVITGTLGIAEKIYLSTNAADKIISDVSMTQGILSKTEAAATISASTILNGALALLANITSDIDSNVIIGAIAHADTDFYSTVKSDVVVGADIYANNDITADVLSVLYVGADVYAATNAYEIISAAVGAESEEMQAALIDVTLNPGDTLVIDNDNYVVMLNGDNVIHLHSGAWPQLNRRTRKIEVQTGSPADLDISMLYTERYL